MSTVIGKGNFMTSLCSRSSKEDQSADGTPCRFSVEHGKCSEPRTRVIFYHWDLASDRMLHVSSHDIIENMLSLYESFIVVFISTDTAVK